MRKENKKNKGFSLVELIIVIAIMAILGAVIAPQYFKHVKNANISSDIEQAARISSAISAEIAADASGMGASTATFTTPQAWTLVSTISDLTGAVSNSKVEKANVFFFMVDSNGGVQVGIAAPAATTVTADHILAPKNVVAASPWN